VTAIQRMFPSMEDNVPSAEGNLPACPPHPTVST
jgi:hypothetical protein